MTNRMSLSLVATLVLACAGSAAPAQAPAASTPQTHVIAGDVTNVSADGKTMTVKSPDGTEKTLKVNSDTTVDGVKATPKKDSHVVVHYTAKAGEDTATGVKDAGKGSWKATEGTVEKVGEGGKWVSVKTKDGSVKTFEVSKKATIESGKGIEEAGKYTGKAGDKVVVYSIVDPSKDVAHFFKKL
jgi:hypothetical protein